MRKAVPIWAVGVVALLVAVLTAGSVVVLRWLNAGELTSAYNGSSTAQQSAPPEFPHMQLQGQFAGPLSGTIIQRWRDPVDGTICYIYVPMVVQHHPAPSGYVQYGSNAIGSIACLAKNTAGAN